MFWNRIANQNHFLDCICCAMVAIAARQGESSRLKIRKLSNRQNYLLNSIGDIQTIITCTGLDDFVNNRFEINKVFRVANGTVDAGQNGGI